jgi:hypothetical protein
MADMPVIDMSNQALDRKYAMDNRLWVQFFKHAIFNEFKSNQEGRHIYDEIDYIKIITPGSRDTFVSEATPVYQQRFPEQWAKYKAQEQQSVSGTPVDMVPWLSVGQVQELKFFNIVTVEQIVNAPDTVAQKFVGFHTLKERARTFLDAAANEAEKTKLTSALAERDTKIQTLTDQVASLTAKLDQLLAKEKK